MSPEIQRKALSPIPLPPLGARVPGDRIAWLPLIFPGQQFVTPMPEILENEISGDDLDHASYPHSESECLTLEIIKSAPEIIQEDEHASVSVEDQPPFNQVECLPAAEVLWRELPLAGDSVVIKELAVLIGIPAYQVLRDLIELGIFSKTTDSISAAVAKEIGCQYGVSFVRRDSVDANETATNDDRTDVAAPSGTFRIANGQDVRPGDWIRDSVLGLGRIIELHTHPDEPDRNRIWFGGQTEDGTLIENHPLLPFTLGIIDKSMVPADILKAAPDIE